MSKLIKLPDGPYIKADKIVSIGEVWKEDHIDTWHYSICYYNINNDETFHVVNLNKTFVTTEDKAREKQKQFVDRLNEYL